MLQKEWSRRTLLSQVRSLTTVGIAISVAGCTNVVNEAGKRGLQISRVDSGATTSDDIKIIVWMRNGWISTVSATLETQIAIQGGKTYRKHRPITIAPGTTEQFAFIYGISKDDAALSKGYRPSAKVL